MTVANGLPNHIELGVNMEKYGFIVMIIFLLGIFAGMIYDTKLKHECRMEAIKALTNPDKIKEICGGK
jgi:hypothetical protein